MIALKRAFPKSAAMQFANFMPGEWLPARDRGYLRTVYERAKELKVGVGGPDLLPHMSGQMSHSYLLIRACAGKVPTGIAVQDGNSGSRSPFQSWWNLRRNISRFFRHKSEGGNLSVSSGNSGNPARTSVIPG